VDQWAYRGRHLEWIGTAARVAVQQSDHVILTVARTTLAGVLVLACLY
jgi:hypothetical protein